MLAELLASLGLDNYKRPAVQPSFGFQAEILTSLGRDHVSFQVGFTWCEAPTFFC
jgi:hypothetical protein